MAETFSESELRELCFDLAVDFEELGPGNKSDKIIGLIGFAQRRGQLGDLLAAITDARPSLEWPILEVLLVGNVEVTRDLGQTLSQIYTQNQQQSPDVPRLDTGLWSAFDFDAAAAKYKKHLEEHYGFLQVLGYNRPVSLENIFTEVFLYGRPLALRRLTIEDLEKRLPDGLLDPFGTERVDGLSLLQAESRLFILGQPGAGKTTFLKYVALQVAKGHLPGIPLFISLKALADSQKPLLAGCRKSNLYGSTVDII